MNVTQTINILIFSLVVAPKYPIFTFGIPTDIYNSNVINNSN